MGTNCNSPKNKGQNNNLVNNQQINRIASNSPVSNAPNTPGGMPTAQPIVASNNTNLPNSTPTPEITGGEANNNNIPEDGKVIQDKPPNENKPPNIEENPEIQKYKNQIKNLEVEKIKLQNEMAILLKDKEKMQQQLKESEEKYKDLTEPTLVGLNNIGATCYMNATLQSLSNSSKLTHYFLETYKKEYNPNDQRKIITNEYYKVVNELWKRENNGKSISPTSFKDEISKQNPLFKGIQANDSKDLINFLLEKFHKELLKNPQNNDNNQMVSDTDQLSPKKMLDVFIQDLSNNKTIIADLFYSVIETKSQCQECKQIKYSYQVYSFLEFPLEQVNKFCFNNHRRNININASMNNMNSDINIYECFDYFQNLEPMTGENRMHCNFCKMEFDGLYGTSLYSAANILIINLNRGKGAVYKCNVIYPEKLNILNYVQFKEGNTYFELYAVICHLGESSMSGHFIAYCKHKTDKKWYKYNDGIVSPCSNNDEYLGKNPNIMPYILFYQNL